jgi:ATP synthase protein I
MTDPRETKRPENADGPGSLTSDLAARIARARGEHPGQQTEARQRETTGMGRAFRLASEFVAAILVGLGLGWGVDTLFNTTPWGIIVLLLLGFAAGVLNVVRAAAEINAANPVTPDMPVIKDDDDE